jgi:hypothetical protein
MRVQKKTAAEWKRLTELYESRGSGISREEFCRTHHIARSTLDFWRRRSGNQAVVKLVSVKVAAPAKAAQAAQPTSVARTGFVLSLPNGRRIESTWQFGDAELARLIRIAESA